MNFLEGFGVIFLTICGFLAVLYIFDVIQRGVSKLRNERYMEEWNKRIRLERYIEKALLSREDFCLYETPRGLQIHNHLCELTNNPRLIKKGEIKNP